MTTAFCLSSIKEPRIMVTEKGEEHGLLRVTANSVPDNEFKRFKEKDRESMKKMKAEQSKMVTVTYLHKKGNDQRRELTYCLWDGDPLLKYKFIPEYEYEVPQGLVDMINKKKSIKRSDLLDKYGRPMLKDEIVASDDMFVRAM